MYQLKYLLVIYSITIIIIEAGGKISSKMAHCGETIPIGCNNCLPGIFQTTIEIEETLDPIYSILIFNYYGVYHKRHVCKSVDGNSIRLYGLVVCKHAMEKLYGGKSLTDDVECTDIILPNDRYRHGKVKGKWLVHRVAKCVHENGTFFVLNGPTNYYYVFDHPETPGSPEQGAEIKAVLHIPFEINDFGDVPLNETTNTKLVDTVYVVYGTLAKDADYKHHVCNKLDSGVRIGEEICRKILKHEFMASQHRVHLDVKVKCEYKSVHRCILDSKNRPILSSSIRMAKCLYSMYQITNKFYFFNGPDENLYFIVEQDPKYKNYWIFTALLKIETDEF